MKTKIIDFYKKYEYLLYALLFLVIAFLLRISWLNFASHDYKGALSVWYNEIKALGGWKGISSTIGDYPVIYKYLIALMTYLPMESTTAFKFVSCIFDVILAIYVGLCIFHVKKDQLLALAGYVAVLFLPNVWINSAVWAQCDAIFTCFCVMRFYYLLKKDDAKAVVFFTIAFAFKIQAIFFLPVLVILLFKGELKPKALLYAPLTYIICVLPAIITGMDWKYALAGAYLKQIDSNRPITNYTANIYIFFPDGFFQKNLIKQFILMCVGFFGILGLFFWKKSGKKTSNELLICMAYFFSLVVPYFLPRMHERYYFTADIFAIIFGLCFLKKIHISFLTIVPSFLGLIYVLFGLVLCGGKTDNINLQFNSFLIGTGIILLAYFIMDILKREENELKNDIAE